jgi:hypothetical protein
MVCDVEWSRTGASAVDDGVHASPLRSTRTTGRIFFPLAPSVGIKTPARPGRPVCQLRPARWTSRARVWLTEHAESTVPALRVQLCTARAAADARERNSALQRARGAPASRT